MVCDLNGSGYAVRTASKQSKKAKNPWFSLWGKQKSHALIIQILEVLGYTDQPESGDDDNSSDTVLHRLFSRIPVGPVSSHTSDELNRIQALALLSKNDDVNFGVDKEAVAYAKFLQSEVSCRTINEKLAGKIDPSLSAILFYAQGFIAEVLGPCPQLADLNFSFGPGATVGTVKNKTTPLWKLSPDVTLTSSMLPLVEELRQCMPGWLASPVTRFSFVTGRLEFVAKNWQTERSILITGTLNALVQRGYGLDMKRKLMRAGLNLSTGQSKHRQLAREASVLDNWSTIDLSAASDSIAWRLVLDLLPWDWFQALDLVRDREVTYGSEHLILEKFSSMGCGFTFELETLIFWALIYGICRYEKKPFEASVYGDDIIVRPDVAILIEHYFPEFGFAVNQEKSFITGLFKESCGGDYYNGVDVRPFFLRSLRFGGRFTYHSVCSFYNFLQRKPWFDNGGTLRDILYHAIPAKLRLIGPDGYGDGHLIVDIDHLELPLKNSDGVDPYFTFKTHVAVPYLEKSIPTTNMLTYGAFAVYQREHQTIREPAGDWKTTRLPAAKRMRAKTTRIRVLHGEFTSRFGLI